MPIKTIHEEMPSLNMTPMIDIVFLLIIFFMAGTKFAEIEHGMDLDLPQVSSVATLNGAPERKPIHILSDGKIGFDNQIIGLEELTQRLKASVASHQGLSVLVRGDESVDYGYVVRVMAACQTAGINELSIQTQLSAKSGG
ncbi:MAG: biopolymer transporter ExbD [Planctomycetota bacterium]|nr:biopolymer transporter ExbD [Planctomycetota bacterium]